MSFARESAAAATRYLQQNFEPDDRLAIVVLDKRNGAVTQRIAKARTIGAPDFQAWLRYKNAQRCEIYVSMNALHQGARTRQKQDVAVIRHLYLDFDHKGTDAVQALLASPDIPRPNYLISSSPDKWQSVWRVEGFDPEHAETLQRGMARQFSADPAATDCARVLRLPGFYNHKYAQPHYVRAECLSQDVYRPDAFQLPEMPHERQPRSLSTPLPGGEQHLSQSERDWAYAKRALATGTPPTVVIAALTARRQGEKHNSANYAERTVWRAAESLENERGPSR